MSKAVKIAIIGDEFMLPDTFRDEIVAACGADHEIRTMSNGWPDVDMEHGYAKPGMDGLKEYLGEADSVCEFVGDADVLVTQLAPLSDAMMERLPNLKLVAISRGGPVNIDMAAARARDILVVNTPGRNASAVAEFTIGAILAETRLIRVGHESMREARWRGDLYRADRTGRELREMTVGVIGYGNIGTRLVKLLRAFNTRVLVCDPYKQLQPDDMQAGVSKVPLDTLLAESDVVSLHCRVTDETQHIIDADALASMKKEAVLINTARGPLVDYPALTEALRSGGIASAMLETFDVEPIVADSPLVSMEQVTLTPHIAGASVHTVTKAARMAAEEVRRFLNDEPPLNAV